MEILKDKDISELRLVNDEKLNFKINTFNYKQKKAISLLKGYHYKWFWIV